MPRKVKDDELYELHHDRALSEMDVGITNYGENDIILEDKLDKREVRNVSENKHF